MTKIVTLLSGGLDSTTLAYWLMRDYAEREGDDDHIVQYPEMTALSFDYGQRHKKELRVARAMAKRIGAKHHIISLGVDHAAYVAPLATVLGGSVLVDQNATVPDGHYASENMKQTVVPNRNAIMLSIAYGIALAQEADFVVFGAHAGDHAIYPDCRPDFVEMLSNTLRVGAAWTDDELSSVPEIIGPFLDHDKAWIAKQAVELQVPIAETWSCYKGGDIHCGTCGTCYERREAFQLAGVPDPTPYIDSTTEYAAPS